MKKILLPLLAWVAGTMSLLAQPVITQQPTNQIVLLGSNATLSVVVSDLGPLAYQWRLGGTNIPGLINGVAGRWPVDGYSGDGGQASNASLFHPCDVAFDGAGNLFIADTFDNRVRKIDTPGIITLVAGNGDSAYSGDGFAATNASIQEPLAVAVDSSGQVFIADWANNRVRKVDTNGIITTVAGNGYGAITGSGAYTGDGGPATSASLWGPSGVALDTAGNLFIADGGNNVVRRVGADGKISTVVGNGAGGYTGDGGPATNASLASPAIITFDSSGDLLIADSANNCIRKVDTNGVITTLAGNGNAAYSGDGGIATNASLNSPSGVAVDSLGNVFIADTFNFRIRKVDGSGIITTVAGNGAHDTPTDGIPATQASLWYPNGVAVDARENIFIADTFQNRIRAVWAGQSTLSLTNVAQASAGTYDVVVTGLGGSVTSSPVTLTVVTPPGITAQPQSQSVAFERAALLSVTATGTAPLAYQWSFGAIRLVGETNSELLIGSADFTNAGNYQVTVTNLYGSATSSVAAVSVGYPPAITTQPTNLTVFIGSNTLLTAGVTGSGLLSYQWQLNGTNLPNNVITTVAGKSSSGFSGDYGTATNATLNVPVAITSDSAGNLFIADSYNHRIRKINTNGIITTVAGKSSAGYTGDGVAATNAALYYPAGITLDARNNMFIADTMNNRIRKVDANGFIITVAGTNTAGSTGDGGLATSAKLNTDRAVAFDASGNLYIADTYNSRIRKVNTNGIITTVAGNGTASFLGDSGNATSASLNYPYGLTVDSNGNLYIADTRNNRIRKVNTNGIITTVAGKGPSYPSSGTYSGDGGAATNAYINNPRGVTIDPVGNLLIADAGNNRVRKVDVNGLISTVAGKSTFGFSGDGGTSTNASLYDPEGIAFDTAGNLMIADSSNARIRKVFLYASFNPLSLHNLSPKDAGDYRLVVTSAFGSVTSSVATLTVLVPPQQFTGQFAGGGLHVQFVGTPNYPYILQSATNLTPPINWQPVLTNPADSNGNWQFTDSNLNNGQKFYRAVGQ